MPNVSSSPDAFPSSRATLTVDQDGVRQTFRIDGAVTVGREPGCNVLLSSPTVSRRHALVAPTGDGWIVRDLGSGNGTFLDARRVDEARLPNGVAIRFGSVAAWFEEEPEAPLTASQKIQRSLTQTLSIQPARRTRKKAAVAAIAAGVALLIGASVYRGCSSHATGALRPEASSRPPDAGNARN